MGIQVTESRRLDEVRCVACIRSEEQAKSARAEAAAARKQERVEQKPVLEQRWSSLIAAIPAASESELAGYFDGTVIEPFDYVFEETRVRLVSLEAGRVFEWMDSSDGPDLRILHGETSGEPRSHAPLARLCDLVYAGRLSDRTADGRRVRKLAGYPARVVAAALRETEVPPVRHSLFIYRRRGESQSNDWSPRDFDELKRIKRSGGRARVKAWLFTESMGGDELIRVVRRGTGLVVTEDGSFARLSHHLRRFPPRRGKRTTIDPLFDAIEVGEVEMLGDVCLDMSTGELHPDDLRMIREYLQSEDEP